MKEIKNFTLRDIVAIVVSDVDIFLLQNKEQTEDLEKDNFTKEEIRNQLLKTVDNICSGITMAGINIDKPLNFKDHIIDPYGKPFKPSKN